MGGGYLVGKALDPLWEKAFGPSKRVRQLESRLYSFESNVRKRDYETAEMIRKFREDLDQRTTRAEVEAIVRSTNYRLSRLESRVTDIDDRLRKIESPKFPGAYRLFRDKNGVEYLGEADIFQFARAPMRKWRDKTGGPIATARLIEVSPDGLVLSYLSGSRTSQVTIEWHRVSALDQAYVLAEAKRTGLPVGAIWKKQKLASRTNSKDTLAASKLVRNP